MRQKLLPALPYLILAACVFAGWMWHAGDQRVAAIAPPPQSEAAPRITVGGPFSLVDQHGTPVTDQTYRGKFMLVFFGFTYCPDVCPTTLAVMSAAFDKLGAKADAIAPLFITIDPARDTPEELKNYLDAFGPRFIGLTGTDAQVAAAAKAYRVYYQKHDLPGGDYTLDHTSILYLMDPQGKMVTNYTVEQGPDVIAADLEKRLKGQS